MIDDLEAVLARDLVLEPLDVRVEEFHHLAGVEVDHVIMVAAFVQLVAGLRRPAGTVVEHVLAHQAGGFELVQHAVDRGQADVLALVDQQAVNVVGGDVLLVGTVEQLQDAQPREGDLEAGLAQFAGFFGHSGSTG